jgi:hypothetical protein
MTRLPNTDLGALLSLPRNLELDHRSAGLELDRVQAAMAKSDDPDTTSEFGGH